jgi:serine phosphatase RsbU (regulator of sigma subunit)
MWLDQTQRLMQAGNELFSQNTPDGAFATLFFGDYSVSTGRLRYANCGHLPPVILRRDGSVERLEATGIVLGVFKKWDCKIGESTSVRAILLRSTPDGITESFNKQGEEFGEERLMECLRRNRELCSESMVSAIVDEVRVFSNASEQHDDITLIIAKSAGAADWKGN